MKSISMTVRALIATSSAIAGVSFASSAAAQAAPTGAPPPDAKALVDAPKGPADAPEIKKPTDGTSVSLSAGGQWAAGNSNLLAGTVNGILDLRRGENGFGAALIGNYGQSAPPGKEETANTENLQGRIRYDRYLSERVSLFGIVTGRHDRFQGLDFRLNLDPGVKFIFVRETTHSLWVEGGYDFQYDVRRNDARVQVDAAGAPIPGAPLLDKTATDHSSRLFVGYRHGFNKEVTLSTGVEYLQSLIASTRYRINFDALLAAKVGAGFSVGVGFSLRFDHDPLPSKEETDTTTTVSLIYAYNDVPETPPAPTCPCPPPTPAPALATPPPPAASAPAAAPESTQ